MINLADFAQIIIALSVGFVWIVRLDNIVLEFKPFGISPLVRNLVGAVKISLSTLLIVGIWHESLALVPALLMAFLMICAQIAHFRVRNPWPKFVPSFLLIILCLFGAAVHSNINKL